MVQKYQQSQSKIVFIDQLVDSQEENYVADSERYAKEKCAQEQTKNADLLDQFIDYNQSQNATGEELQKQQLEEDAVHSQNTVLTKDANIQIRSASFTERQLKLQKQKDVFGEQQNHSDLNTHIEEDSVAHTTNYQAELLKTHVVIEERNSLSEQHTGRREEYVQEAGQNILAAQVHSNVFILERNIDASSLRS